MTCFSRAESTFPTCVVPTSHLQGLRGICSMRQCWWKREGRGICPPHNGILSPCCVGTGLVWETVLVMALLSDSWCHRWPWPALRSGGPQRWAWHLPGWRKAMRMPWRTITRNKWPSSKPSSPCWSASSPRETGRRSWPYAPSMSMPGMWWPRWLLRRWVPDSQECRSFWAPTLWILRLGRSSYMAKTQGLQTLHQPGNWERITVAAHAFRTPAEQHHLSGSCFLCCAGQHTALLTGTQHPTPRASRPLWILWPRGRLLPIAPCDSPTSSAMPSLGGQCPGFPLAVPAAASLGWRGQTLLCQHLWCSVSILLWVPGKYTSPGDHAFDRQVSTGVSHWQRTLLLFGSHHPMTTQCHLLLPTELQGEGQTQPNRGKIKLKGCRAEPVSEQTPEQIDEPWLFEEWLGSPTHLDSHSSCDTYQLLFDHENLDMILGLFIHEMEVVTPTWREFCKDKKQECLLRSSGHNKCSVNNSYDYFLINQLAHLFSTSRFGNTKMRARSLLFRSLQFLLPYSPSFIFIINESMPDPELVTGNTKMTKS